MSLTIQLPRNLTPEQKQQLADAIATARNAREGFNGSYEGATIVLQHNSDLAIDTLVRILASTIFWYGGYGSAEAMAEGLKHAKNVLANRGNQIDAIVKNAVTISPTLGTTPDPLVKTIRYVDPLILDLDGDGLEITPLSKGVLFDANGDAIKTATAWAAADDGMLVWDRNGNGTIDSGQELFWNLEIGSGLVLTWK